MHARQRGITLIGFLMVLAILGFFAYMAMRLFPVYSEWYSVVSAMKGLAKESEVRTMSPDRIRVMFDRRLDMSYVSSIRANDRQKVALRQQGGVPVLHVRYQVERPFIGNLHFVAKFERIEQLTGR